MAAHPQHRLLLTAAVQIGGVALVLAGVLSDVQVVDVQLGVVVSAVDEEAAGGVVDFLLAGLKRVSDVEGIMHFV